MTNQKRVQNGKGFTLVELLVVILIISVLAGFLVPTVMSGRQRVRRVQCTNRLANLGKMALLYADDHRSWFPVADVDDPQAYESFQIMVDTMEGAQNPELYQCPASNDQAPKEDKNADIPFQLGARNVSYAWRNEPLKTGKSSRSLLGADNSIADKKEGIEENHEGGMNAMKVDASVKWLNVKPEMEDDQDYQDGGLEGFFAANKLGI